MFYDWCNLTGKSFAPAQVTDKTSALVAQVSSDYFFTFLMENVRFFIRELSLPVETTFLFFFGQNYLQHNFT